jgi:hypothetical protein
MNAEPAFVERTKRSLKLRRNCTAGEASEPKVAVAITHFGGVQGAVDVTTFVVVESTLVVVDVIGDVVWIVVVGVAVVVAVAVVVGVVVAVVNDVDVVVVAAVVVVVGVTVKEPVAESLVPALV